MIGLLLLASVCVPVVEAAAQSAETLYTRALARERGVRGRTASLKQLRAAVAQYENLVHRFPTSPYSDNALWQGGNLALLAYDQYKQASDKKTGLRLLGLLRSQYPSSSLVPRAVAIVRQREKPSATAAAAPAATSPAPVKSEPTPVPASPVPAAPIPVTPPVVVAEPDLPVTPPPSAPARRPRSLFVI